MWKSVLPFVAVCLLAAADSPKSALKKLEGTYTMVSGEKEGKKLSEDVVKAASLVIKGNKHTVHVGDDTIVGTHKVNAAKTPHTIDATDTEGPFKGKTVL